MAVRIAGLIGLASFGVTVAGVTRQRRGDGWLEVRSAQRDGFLDRLGSLFRFPCPTSSATRAQVWLDLKSNGLPVLTIGVTLAIVILLMSAVAGPIDTAWNADPRVSRPIRECFWARAFPPLFCPMTLHVSPRFVSRRLLFSIVLLRLPTPAIAQSVAGSSCIAVPRTLDV
jgi:hypothetical protein